jgi:hypothetical protein
MSLDNLVYFNSNCAVNSIIKFINNDFILLEPNIRGKFIYTNNILVLIFSDGTKDTFDLSDTKNYYLSNRYGIYLYRREDHLIKTNFEPKSVGVAIGTYGSIAYVHLHLENSKKLYPTAKILVIDDYSLETKKIEKLCLSYGADFLSSPHHKGHFVGDVYIVANAIKWAYQHNLSYFYKLSRRFVPTINIEEIVKTIYHNEFAIYSNVCDWGIRSECMLMHTELWYKYCLSCLEDYIYFSTRDAMPHPVPEVLYTKLCKRFYYNISHANNIILNNELNSDKIKRGCVFGILPFTTNNRGLKSNNYLWHSANGKEDFYNYAKYLGLNYTISNFNPDFPYGSN